MRKIISQLNLNDQQKADIKKIMDSGMHGKERREAIAKALTRNKPPNSKPWSSNNANSKDSPSTSPRQVIAPA